MHRTTDGNRVALQRRTTAHQARLWVFLLASLMLLESGCVRRRLNVYSNPPGALVYVDNQQIGTTPCSVDFTYYGTREIRLVKPGYETLTVNQPIPTPWYEIPPLDFFSENLAGTKIRDNRTVSYNLAPQLIVPNEVLLDRANQLRQDSQQFPVVPAGATVPVPTPVEIPAGAPVLANPPVAPPPAMQNP
jgi:PEGA domain-containing protein